MNERMKLLEAVAMALLRHIEGDDVTRDLITDDDWAGYLSDADYVSGLIFAAGYAVVPREPTPKMCSMGADELPTPTCESTDEEAAAEVYRAMLAASEPQP